jgi:hypothetical protein
MVKKVLLAFSESDFDAMKVRKGSRTWEELVLEAIMKMEECPVKGRA